MQEVLIYVCEHASRGLEGVVSSLEARLFGTGLIGSMAGQDGGYVENNGSLLKRKRVLGRRLVSEGIKPEDHVLVYQ